MTSKDPDQITSSGVLEQYAKLVKLPLAEAADHARNIRRFRNAQETPMDKFIEGLLQESGIGVQRAERALADKPVAVPSVTATEKLSDASAVEDGPKVNAMNESVTEAEDAPAAQPRLKASRGGGRR